MDIQYAIHCLVDMQYAIHCLVDMQYAIQCLVDMQYAIHCLVDMQYAVHCLVDMQYAVHCLVDMQYAIHCLVDMQYAVHCLVDMQYAIQCLVDMQYACYVNIPTLVTNYSTKGNIFTVNQYISQQLTPIMILWILKKLFHNIYYCDLSHILDSTIYYMHSTIFKALYNTCKVILCSVSMQ